MAEGISTYSGGITYRDDPASERTFSRGFEWPQELPFSELGPQIVRDWAPRPEPGKKYEGEHWEVTGQSGSGKSYLLKTTLHMKALTRDTPTIYICTKADDPTVNALIELGWPICRTFDEVRRHRQCIFWPQTDGIGEDKDRFIEQQIYNLLARIWKPEANTTVVFDEIGYVESLPGPGPGNRARLKRLIRQYWREARALGISIVASKQRPIGVVRDQHSESRWKAVFPPADMGDMQRFAELLGRPLDWEPVLESLDQEQHQFVMRNNVTKASFISWIDFDADAMRPLPRRDEHPLYSRRDDTQR